MIDTAMLKKAIEDSHLLKSYICDRLGMTYATLRRKVNGESPFTVPEMATLVKVLGLSGKETRLIFYAHEDDLKS